VPLVTIVKDGLTNSLEQMCGDILKDRDDDEKIHEL
jgi:hypothetical protein